MCDSLVVGLSFLGAPFKGGLMGPNPDVLITGSPLDGASNVTLETVMPAGLPATGTHLATTPTAAP